MKQMVWCDCSNFNCEWGEGMAEPFSHCCSCGCIVHPVSDLYDLSEEYDEMEGENGD